MIRVVKKSISHYFEANNDQLGQNVQWEPQSEKSEEPLPNDASKRHVKTFNGLMKSRVPLILKSLRSGRELMLLAPAPADITSGYFDSRQCFK